MTLVDNEWKQEVYQKAKSLATEIISEAGRPVPFAEIVAHMKMRYPELCDDSIPDPWTPSQQYWKHRVASALYMLKLAESIRRTPDGWLWRGREKEQEKKRKTSSPRISHRRNSRKAAYGG